MIRIIIISFCLLFSIDGYCQLNPKVISEIAEKQSSKWQSYLNLSDHRRGLLKDLIYQYEFEKAQIIHDNYQEINANLEAHIANYNRELSKILTPREFSIFKVISEDNLDNEQTYLKELASVYLEDEPFISQYLEFRNKEVVPVMVNMRIQLESKLNRNDKLKLDSIRNHVLNFFEECLISCVITPDSSGGFALNETMHLYINNDLQNPQSYISQLLGMVNRYEDDMHQLLIEYKRYLDYWSEWTSELKSKTILDSYNRSFTELNQRNELATLRHIESHAIFLLLDPYDERRSRYLLNIGLFSQL